MADCHVRGKPIGDRKPWLVWYTGWTWARACTCPSWARRWTRRRAARSGTPCGTPPPIACLKRSGCWWRMATDDAHEVERRLRDA